MGWDRCLARCHGLGLPAKQTYGGIHMPRRLLDLTDQQILASQATSKNASKPQASMHQERQDQADRRSRRNFPFTISNVGKERTNLR